MRKAAYYDVVIVGAGHAGANLAINLRQKGFQGSILLVSDETHLPYERPPLSKACLLEHAADEKLWLRPASYWQDARIDLALGLTARTLDPAHKNVQLSDGRKIDFGWCVLATGGRARRLSCPGAGLDGIYILRNMADMQRIRTALATAQRLVVIGGGYIGLEVAASARLLGVAVDVVETQSRLLSRVTSQPVSDYFQSLHHRHGVHFHLGRQVSAITGNGRATGVQLDDGTYLPADLLLVGIGIEAETALAEQAGIACHGGVLVDSTFQSSAPHVLAIGDCARHPNDFAGGLWRLESVQHAQDSAAIAADQIMGHATSYQDVPAFWSEQYDVRLQSAGIARDADDLVVRGDLENGPFSIIYLREGRIIAIDALNSAREFMRARQLIAARARLDAQQLADSAQPLKAVA